MVDIKGLLNSRSGRILISIILGMGLAALFRQSCVGRNCLILKAPNPNGIKGNIYGHDGKCYTYKPSTAKCTGNALKAYNE